MYRAQCWQIKNAQVQKMRVAKIRMLRWLCGHTLRGRIRNKVICDKVGVVPIEDKMREARLRCSGHVMGRESDAPMRRCERISVANARRRRGRPRKHWGEVIRQDMAHLRLTEDGP